MPTARRLVLEATAWGAPLAWAMAWATFRGENAYEAVAWWRQAQIGGLILLLPAALAARSFYWSSHTPRPRSLVAHAIGQVALVAAVLVASWLCFQGGLARRAPPGSVVEFLFNNP